MIWPRIRQNSKRTWKCYRNDFGNGGPPAQKAQTIGAQEQTQHRRRRLPLRKIQNCRSRLSIQISTVPIQTTPFIPQSLLFLVVPLQRQQASLQTTLGLENQERKETECFTYHYKKAWTHHCPDANRQPWIFRGLWSESLVRIGVCPETGPVGHIPCHFPRDRIPISR